MARRERLEDLGVISVKINDLILDMEDKYGHLFDSKHDWEAFEKKSKEHSDFLYDLHCFIRYHFENLNEIGNIAMGNNEE